MNLSNGATTVAWDAWLVWAALGALAVAVVASVLAVALWRQLQRLQRLRRQSPGAADPETPAHGLMSREAFDAAIEQATANPPPGPGSLCLLMADVDSFGAVNDMLGHAAANSVLDTLAQRLHQLAPDKCGFTRLGGDEFLIAKIGTLAQAQTLAARLVDSLAQPVATANGR